MISDLDSPAVYFSGVDAVSLFLGMVQMNLTVPQAAERSSPVILSAAKDLVAGRDRPFAALKVTLCDWSNCQAQFIHIEPCPKTILYSSAPKTAQKREAFRQLLSTI